MKNGDNIPIFSVSDNLYTVHLNKDQIALKSQRARLVFCMTYNSQEETFHLVVVRNSKEGTKTQFILKYHSQFQS